MYTSPEEKPNRLILIIAMVICFIMVFVASQVKGSNKTEIAYMVAIERKQVLKVRYFDNRKEVHDYVLRWSGQSFNFTEILTNSRYFCLRTEKYIVYVEKKRVKHTKKGKKRYRKLKK